MELKRKYMVCVKGDKSKWCFEVDAKPEVVELWRADGLEVTKNPQIAPVWVMNMGLVRQWLFLRDCFYMRNPFN